MDESENSVHVRELRARTFSHPVVACISNLAASLAVLASSWCLCVCVHMCIGVGMRIST